MNSEVRYSVLVLVYTWLFQIIKVLLQVHVIDGYLVWIYAYSCSLSKDH